MSQSNLRNPHGTNVRGNLRKWPVHLSSRKKYVYTVYRGYPKIISTFLYNVNLISLITRFPHISHQHLQSQVTAASASPGTYLGVFVPPRFRPVWSDGSLSIWAASELGTRFPQNCWCQANCGFFGVASRAMGCYIIPWHFWRGKLPIFCWGGFGLNPQFSDLRWRFKLICTWGVWVSCWIKKSHGVGTMGSGV